MYDIINLMKTLKIVCISDTHNHNEELEVDIPNGDILIHSGDATGRGTVAEIVRFNEWLGTLKHKFKHIVFVAGNHDWLFEKDHHLAKSLMTNAIYVENELIELEGLKIYGSPYQPEFCNWAFNVPRGDKIKEKWDNIPYNLDILITHGPPLGFCDTLRKMMITDDEKGKPVYQESMVHLGCEELYKAVIEKKPKYHIFGHIHDGYGVLKTESTTFVNASTCTERYKPSNPPIVLSIKLKT